jgi:hypothetical protein
MGLELRLCLPIILILILFSGCAELKEEVGQKTEDLDLTKSISQNTKTSARANPPIQSLETTPTIQDFCKNEIDWRYILEKSIYCALNQDELLGISSLALELKGEDARESAWEIVEWQSENIEYDWEKASLPAPELVYWSDGRVEVIKGKENIIQTPTETIKRRKGICSDYAILTAALLLEMGYQPVYILDIKFEDSPVGHTTAAIRLDDSYFPVDQLPPILDLGSYYKKWATHQEQFGNKRISTITVYQISFNGSRIVVFNLGNLTADEIKQHDYTIKEKDLKTIRSTIIELVEENFNLKRDVKLNDLEKRKYMPPGYRDGGSWKIKLEYFADYYNPTFHDQFSGYIFKQMLRDEIVKDLKKSNRFWIKVEREGEDLSVILYFARKI